jgi:hypothetical protein
VEDGAGRMGGYRYVPMAASRHFRTRQAQVVLGFRRFSGWPGAGMDKLSLVAGTHQHDVATHVREHEGESTQIGSCRTSPVG